MLKKLTLILVAVVVVVGGLLLTRKITSSQEKISVMVVPHHDIVTEQRLDTFREVANRRQTPEKIILLSPNHYDTGRAVIQVYDQTMSSAHGDVKVATELLPTALAAGAQIENPSFRNEHGIKLILPDIARVFPAAKVLPVMIKAGVAQKLLDTFGEKMRQACPECLVIASVDMSHYQPYAVSEMHDRSTLQALSNLDSEFLLNKAEVDSPPSLYLASKWAKSSGTETFTLHNHTNSTELTADLYAEGTTHIFGWYGNDSQPKKPEVRISFSAVGDIMFSGSMSTDNPRAAHELTSQLGDRVLWGTDAVIGNLEGPITAKQALKKSSAPTFRFNPHSGSVLDYLHFSALNLANNHSLDAGQSGYSDTADHLNKMGIGVLYNNQPHVIDRGEAKLTIFGVNDYEHRDITEQIKMASSQPDHHVAVYVHWGKEFEKQVSERQRQMAQAWVDAGADLVIGTGPHVTQSAEVYKNSPIFYSLGNFLYSKPYNPKGRGYVILGDITRSEINLVVSTVGNTDSQPILLRSKKADDQILAEMPALKPYLTDSKGGLRFTFIR